MNRTHDHLSYPKETDARHALDYARSVYPALCADGVYSETATSRPIQLREIETALAYLRHCETRAHLRYRLKRKCSYRVKEWAEQWAETQVGMHQYVSNGALIAAALYVGFRVEHRWQDSPRVQITSVA